MSAVFDPPNAQLRLIASCAQRDLGFPTDGGEFEAFYTPADGKEVLGHEAIGTVVGLASEAEGWERVYLVRPAVHPAAASHVMILGGAPGARVGDLKSAFEAAGEAP